MNYFAHALPLLDRPYFAAGTGVPDWLTVADRRLRLRAKHVEPFLADTDPVVAAVAGGVSRHLDEDARFHKTRAFTELSWQLTVMVRDALSDRDGLRPSFLGHLLLEILLDAALIEENPRLLERYYQLLEEIEPALVEAAVNRMAPRPTERLAIMIAEFRRQRVLWDYLQDDKLLMRLNQIMQRVKLPLLPDDFADVLPTARPIVGKRKNDLLECIRS
ncbi:MAG: hypothetical protein ABSA16_04975 [Thermoguttaceae bacterium]|jgi:hypothetical protein